MPGNRLFTPSDSLSPRDPQLNVKDQGMFVNPPTYAEVGGLTSGSATGIYKNGARIRRPQGTQSSVPFNNKGA
jgi:hypothetical protein